MPLLSLFCPKYNFTMRWNILWWSILISWTWFFKKYLLCSHTEKVKKYIRKGKKSINQQKKVAKILEKSDVLFWLSYLPPLSDFVPFCLTPPPPLKSDIIYACSLILYELFQSRWNILLVQTGLGVIQKIKGNKNLIPSIRSGQNF